jgi:hypothetical protein
MVSFEEFCKQTPGPRTRENYEAWLQFCQRAQCSLGDTFEECRTKQNAAMSIIQQEMEENVSLGFHHLREFMERA